ncbi:MAG: type VI secretion system amidase effector protein Tae4 [Azoarcus sp.]|jgi:hypothetical protein|nr:type VI secretion system amidase effector protein Tae4 [Azoarcus sp.]
MPSFTTLKDNHYSSNINSQDHKKAADVYQEIGYDYEELLLQNDQYKNTCAVRMSLALLKSDVRFGHPISRLEIKSGHYKGRFVATGAKTLADELRKPTVLGEPLTGKKAEEVIKAKKGIVFFHGITGYGGGHIDLIEPGRVCHSDCYFDEGYREIWFWPMD